LIVVVCSIFLFSQSVDQSGAFTYSVSIEVPPGTGDLTPELSLNYNSNRGNGFCGMGWSLSGLSVITRDLSYPVSFSDDDHYLLDGQKLIEINDAGTYKEYRTERESFLHIRGYNLNTANSYWQVTAKNGRVMYYGRSDSQHDSSNDGHIAAVGKSGKARVWSVSRVGDARGNYYYVTYLEDDENGDYYPLQLIYSQNDAAPLSSMRVVSFSYEERDDHYATYNPSKIDIDYRLKWITITMGANTSGTGGNLVRKYGLEYEYGDSTGRSRITAVQPFGDNGDIPDLPTVVSGYEGTGSVLNKYGFEWQATSAGWTDISDDEDRQSPLIFAGRSASVSLGYNCGVRLVDLDGNGYVDIIRGFYDYGSSSRTAYLNTGEGWEESSAFAPPVDIAGRNSSTPAGWDCGTRFVDLNGDGLQDIIQGHYDYGSSSRTAYLNTGGGWEESSEYASPIDITARDSDTPGGWDCGVRLVDLNGDGLNDIIAGHNNYGNSYRTAYINSGQGWEESSAFAPLVDMVGSDSSAPAGWDYGTRFVDLNGDGLQDLIQRAHYESSIYFQATYLNTGEGWEEASAYASPVDIVRGEEYFDWDGGVRFVDLNGDGLQDIIKGLDSFGSTFRTAYLNTGEGWEESSDYASPVDIVGVDSNYMTGWDTGTRFVDLNGDGLIDIIQGHCAYGSTSQTAYLNTGKGWEEALEYAPAVNITQRNSSSYGGSWDCGTRLADLNGDGLIDVIKAYIYYSSLGAISQGIISLGGSDNHTSYNSGVLPDYMVLVTTPSDASISLTYTPSPQLEGAICPENSSNPIIANKSPRMLVTQLTVDDGIGNEQITDYAYHNGLFKTGYRNERKNLGFEWIEKHDQQTGATTRIWYNQDPDTFYGLVEKTEVYFEDVYDSAVFWSIKENTYELNSTTGAVELRRVVERVAHLAYNLVSTMVEYPEYDSWGNRLSSIDYGEVTYPGLVNLDVYDDITKEVEYLTLDSESRYISVPSREQTHAYTLDGLLTTVAENRYLYDGDTAGGYVYTGLVTRKEFENGDDDSVMEYGYDDYGNLIWTDDARTVSGEVTPASGHSAQLTYDSDYATYVISKTDVDGNTETVSYDDHMQPVTVTDVNGVVWKKVYDEFGRVIAEIAPGDSETEPTKRYTYSDLLIEVSPNWVKTEVKDSASDETASYLTAYVYSDGLGRELQRKSEASGDRWTTIDTHYDITGRKWKTSVPYYSDAWEYNSSDERNSSERRFSETLYDGVGRVVEEIYSDGTSTKKKYGKRSIITMDPAGHVSARSVYGRDVF
jgi:YD repeat-containing protein